MKTESLNTSTPILAALVVGTFMSALDTSAVTVAASTIQNNFAVSLASVEWVITAYLLVISGLLLTFGRLADMHGHRKIYVSGFAVFTSGSLLCGLAPNILFLVGFRVLQALGAAMMFSSSSAIITVSIPAERRGKAFGVIAVAVAAACCIGPVAGGLLVGVFGWRSIFLINVPIGIFGTALAWKRIPPDSPQPAQRFDLTGSALVFAALFLVLLPLDLSATSGLSPLQFWAVTGSGLVLVALFIVRETRTEQPILNPALFKSRIFSTGLIATTFNFAAQFMMAFLAPYYLQNVRAFSPMSAGLLYLPMPLATIVAAPLSGGFSDRHDSRLLGAAGMAAMAAGLFMLAGLDAATPSWYIALAMALAGAGHGMFQSPNNSSIMGSVPEGNRGAASGTLATMRNIGMVLGVALSGAMYHDYSARAHSAMEAGGLSGKALSDATATYGLRITFLAASCAALIAMTATLAKGKTRDVALQPDLHA